MHLGLLSDLISSGDEVVSPFSFAAAYHCLEHVPDPKEFVQQLFNVISPGGSVFLSMPFSPMSVEIDWYDPFNHPPHHITRWNRRSLETLADVVGANVRFYFPDEVPLRQLAKVSCTASVFGRPKMFKEPWQQRAARRHPLMWLSHLMKQHFRRKRLGSSADVVLVEITLRGSEIT